MSASLDPAGRASTLLTPSTARGGSDPGVELLARVEASLRTGATVPGSELAEALRISIGALAGGSASPEGFLRFLLSGSGGNQCAGYDYAMAILLALVGPGDGIAKALGLPPPQASLAAAEVLSRASEYNVADVTEAMVREDVAGLAVVDPTARCVAIFVRGTPSEIDLALRRVFGPG